MTDIPTTDTSAATDALRDRLATFAADLVQHRRHQVFVWRLLRRPAGQWQSVRELCAGAADCPPVFWQPEDGGEGDVLHAMWVPWPGTVAGEDHATILFFHAQLLWTHGAYYNAAVGHRAPLTLLGDGDDEQGATGEAE